MSEGPEDGSHASASSRLVFVLSPFQNAYFRELTDALTAAVRRHGTAVEVVHDPGVLAVEEDDVFVVMPPHEYDRLEPDGLLSDSACAQRTIGISAEQPHQFYFRDNAALAARLGAVLDFSERAVVAYRQLGIDAEHLPFGFVPEWDRFASAPPPADRSVPALYLGNKQPRRLSILAEHADALAGVGARVRISDNSEPNLGDSASFVTGEGKRDLLSRAGLLINIHQGDEPYFEWLRFADAAHCGTPVLTETSSDTAPFVDGQHFLSFAPDDLGAQLRAAREQPARLRDIAEAAYETLRGRPLVDGVERLIAAADRVRQLAPPPASVPAARRSSPLGRARVDPEPTTSWRASRRKRVVDSVLRRGRRATLVAPPGTTLPAGAGPVFDGGFAIVMAAGRTADGVPTLEGLWPWEPWRLVYGQHLGRIMLVDEELLAAATAWLRDPWATEHPHLAVQLFAATRGIEGAHIDRPVARLAVAAEPDQAIPPELAERCRALLGGLQS